MSRTAKPLGINLFVNESCSGVAPSAAARPVAAAMGSQVLPIGRDATRGAGLVGWTYPDEPDNNGWTPASLAKTHPYPRGNADGLVTFVTTTGRFFRQAPYGSTRSRWPSTRGSRGSPTSPGFDLYPLNACQSDLTAVYDAQQAFVRLAGSTPTFQWIETGPIRPTYCGGFTMSPDAVERRGLARGHRRRARDRVLHAHLVAGSQLVRRRAGVAACHEADQRLLATVKPGLLGTRSSRLPTARLSRWSRASAAAAPTSSRSTRWSAPNKAQIHVPQLHDGTVKVLGEGRTVAVRDHYLVDNFAGLQVHVYVQTR